MEEERKQEIELLEAMFPDKEELNVDSSRILFRAHPAAEEGVGVKLVRADIAFDLPAAYPKEPPRCTVRSCRGLDDAAAVELDRVLQAKVKELTGELALLALITEAKDFLSSVNDRGPTGSCAICLEPLADADSGFCRTACYHSFHNTCLARWCAYELKRGEAKARDQTMVHLLAPWEREERAKARPAEPPCPTCRTPLGEEETAPLRVLGLLEREAAGVDLSPATYAPPGAPNFEASAALRAIQRRYEAGLQRQRARDGLFESRSTADASGVMLVRNDLALLAPPASPGAEPPGDFPAAPAAAAAAAGGDAAGGTSRGAPACGGARAGAHRRPCARSCRQAGIGGWAERQRTRGRSRWRPRRRPGAGERHEAAPSGPPREEAGGQRAPLRTLAEAEAPAAAEAAPAVGGRASAAAPAAGAARRAAAAGRRRGARRCGGRGGG
eukprot:tig00001067_g6767.t1